MNYSAALKALEARRETRVELGLARVRRVLKILGNPQEAYSSIHVAGTNGKGSVCAMLESVLRHAGYETGLYLSPHLWSVRERIQVRGRMISHKDFGLALAAVFLAEKKARTRMTYFELLTCAAFWHFRRSGVRAAVLETGLGGRLDATNVVRSPSVCVISSVDFDHMEFLGSTLGQIAREKAGIIKRGRPVICPRLRPEAMAVVRRRARERRAPLRVVSRPWRSVRAFWKDNIQRLQDGSGGRFSVGILGAKQGLNAAVARAALEAVRRELPVPERAWREGLRRTRWPLRFEVRRAGRRTIVLDGAHNPEAARGLAATWSVSPWASGPSRWIMGVMRDKDARAVVEALAPLLRDVVACPPPNPRALPAAELARMTREAAPDARVRTALGAPAAVRAWLREKGAPKTAVVCGSFYLAARAARAVGGRRSGRPR